jgi:hypothetical protein
MSQMGFTIDGLLAPANRGLRRQKNLHIFCSPVIFISLPNLGTHRVACQKKDQNMGGGYIWATVFCSDQNGIFVKEILGEDRWNKRFLVSYQQSCGADAGEVKV